MTPVRTVLPWVLTLLTSCTVGPEYQAPAAMTGSASSTTLLEASSTAFSAAAPPGEWWHLYDAPALDSLVGKALVHNEDLRTALANLQAAQASLHATELQRTPQTRFGANVTYGQASADQLNAPGALTPGPVYALTELISYDFDLFGRITRSIQEGAADVDAARAALDLVRVNVAGSVTGAYATVCAAGNQIDVANRSIALAGSIVAVTTRRFQGGIASINDAIRARALLAQTESDLPELIARQRAGLYLLATLTGDSPEDFPRTVATCNVPLVIRRPIPVGDGMSLLRRRPDIREAERRLAASVADIGVATSALYPSVTLGAQLGTVATKSGDILQNRAFTWSLGPMVSWNFPNISVVEAEIARTDAVARANLATFDRTVLTALQETETGLSALARQLDTERALKEAHDQAAIAARNIETLYAGGVGEFIDTLDAERTLIQADAALAAATAKVADLQVRLFMVLGGGWQDAPQPAETPLDEVARDRAPRDWPVDQAATTGRFRKG